MAYTEILKMLDNLRDSLSLELNNLYKERTFESAEDKEFEIKSKLEIIGEIKSDVVSLGLQELKDN